MSVVWYSELIREIMHQLGLAVMYAPETGMSGGAMVATDGAWNYSDEQIERAKQNGGLDNAQNTGRDTAT